MTQNVDEKSVYINVWLVGDTISTLNPLNLPLGLEVLRLFFHYKKIGRKTVEQSAKQCAEEIESIWEKTAIPTLLPRNIILKIESLKKKYETLQKSRFRRTEIQLNKETEFYDSLNKLFDITSQANHPLPISRDQRVFLEDQRGCRQLKTSSLNTLEGPLILSKRYESDSDSDESNQNESGVSDYEDFLSENDSDDSNTQLLKTKIFKTMLNST